MMATPNSLTAEISSSLLRPPRSSSKKLGAAESGQLSAPRSRSASRSSRSSNRYNKIFIVRRISTVTLNNCFTSSLVILLINL